MELSNVIYDDKPIIISDTYKKRRLKPELVIFHNTVYFDVTEIFQKAWEIGEEPRIIIKKERGRKHGKKQSID